MSPAAARTLATDGAVLGWTVRGPLPPPDGRPPLLMIGSPMTGEGFETLASSFPDRTVLTCDPRGLGASTRSDGSDRQVPAVTARDLHALVVEVGGRVDLFGSSGGAVNALAFAAAHPGDVATVVAHEPPLLGVLPDAASARRGWASVRRTYDEHGWGAGMAHFVAYTGWQGEYTDAYLDSPPPDPATSGLPAQDDGSRDDPLLSAASEAVVEHELDVAALRGSAVRLLLAAGVGSRGTMTWRTTRAASEVLGAPFVEFPSHHGGFLGGEFGQHGEPEAFAARLREVLDGSTGP